MITIQDSNLHLVSFKNGISILCNGLAAKAANNKREESKRNEEFRVAFTGLISTVKQAQKNGVWRKTYFNLFETFGYHRLEEAHSNILAWLLNPEESHGIGDIFLRDFIKTVFNPKELPVYHPVNIMREKQEGSDRPDIIVQGKNWWLVIENKIDSREQEDQTKRYADKYKCRGKLRENIFLAFLSPSGWQPESCDFTPVSYRTIRQLLENMQFQGDSNILIRHFVDHIFLDLEE
jgi:hypothetical protein